MDGLYIRVYIANHDLEGHLSIHPSRLSIGTWLGKEPPSEVTSPSANQSSRREPFAHSRHGGCATRYVFTT